MKKKVIYMLPLMTVLISFLMVFSTGTVASARFNSISNGKSISEIANSTLNRQTFFEADVRIDRVSNLQKFKKMLKKDKHLSDYEAGKEMLKAMNYDEELIDHLPRDAIFEALNFSENFTTTEFIPINESAEDNKTDETVANAASDTTRTSNGIIITNSMTVDKTNRQIKHAAWFDCSNVQLDYLTDSFQSEIIKHRGYHLISIQTTEGAKFSPQNRSDGACFAIMSYDYHEKNSTHLRLKRITIIAAEDIC